MAGTLSLTDAVRVATVVDAAIHGQRVARLMPDDSPLAGEIVEGTARSIGDRSGCYLRNDEDVRDGYLRVTTTTGFDAYWRVSDLMREVGDTFVPNRER